MRHVESCILLATLMIGLRGNPALAGPFEGPEHQHGPECDHEHPVYMHEPRENDKHSRLRDLFQHNIPKDAGAEAAYYARHTQARAGFPNCLGHFNHPSNRPADCGYYVGGGACGHGDARCRNEGTWGWDYCHGILPSKVMLGWYHGRRYQDGVGSYRVNGRHIPDIFAIDYHAATRRHFGGGD